MIEALTNNPFFGIVLTILAFAAAKWIYSKSKSSLLNPFLVSLILIVALILGFKIPLTHYLKGAVYLELMLPVSITLLALPLYRQRRLLHLHKLPIFAGISAGVITCIVSTIILCRLFQIDIILIKSLIPRSITTPLGLLMVEKLDGIGSIAMVAIIFNGLFGVMIYAPVYAIFRIHNPIAQGIALGTTSHAIGTAKAMELGEVTGAMSGLAIVLAGLITVAATPFVNYFLP
jgi:putative effector of murein hydrolase